MDVDLSQFSPREIFEDILPELAKHYNEITKAINAILAIELSGEKGGTWSLDLTGTPVASRGIVEGAHCIVKMEADLFKSLVKMGKIAPCVVAYSKRKINIEGDIPTVLKVGNLMKAAMKNEKLADGSV